MDRIMSIFGTEDFRSWNIYKSFLAEFIGTGLLVIVGCGATLSDQSTMEIALAFGLAVGVIVSVICEVSGGHINPAVTIGLVIGGHCTILRAICYVIVQLAGASVGALILFGLVPSDARSKLGLTTVSDSINSGQAVAIEVIITFFLVFVVSAVCDANRTNGVNSAPLMIGLSITTCHLWAIPYTGSSMNTARTFGPALVTNRWSDHWVYWIGPIVGGIIAALLYRFVFAASKAKEEEKSSDENTENRPRV